ncbi:ELWxxDGT repeat protein [Planctomicrobium piriforme]|uniref:ELWxxDGT repeat protein n=1 Tax=Planctomicrobium piriforme TaxID=1576369 RepID=UPI0015876123|nr:ELWxxDGT repeat protein [Planctomicrobium piriforme]
MHSIEAVEQRVLLSATQVVDINGKASGSSVDSLVTVGNTVFFAANDGVNGTELWKSDGTAAGTVLVKDIYAGIGSSFPQKLANVNGTLYFSAYLPATGWEVWKSDGTANGTVMVADVSVGTGSSFPEMFTNVNGTVYFSANDGVHGDELWATDGSAAGTRLVKDLVSGSSFGWPDAFTPVGNLLFFRGYDDNSQLRVWRSDGTTAGTFPIQAGSNAVPDQFVALNGTLYYRDFDLTNGFRLWKTDGTDAGTGIVTLTMHDPQEICVVGSTLYFNAYGSSLDRELWKSDGTDAGTVQVKDLAPGNASGWPHDLTNVNGALYFRANSDELWKSDGTAAGTVLLKDIIPGTSIGSYSNWTSVAGKLAFVVYDGTPGGKLWVSDGTSEGTMIADDGVQFGYLPQDLAALKDQVLFAGTLTTSGTELFRIPLNSVPTDLKLSSTTVVENRPIGTVVGTLSAVDPDLNDTFTYSFGTGTGAADNALFTILGNQLRTKAVFDYETKSSYFLRLRVVDQLGHAFAKSVTIRVLNGNDAPVVTGFGGSVTYVENASSVTVLPAATVTDPDSPNFAGGKVTISLTSNADDRDLLAFANQGNAAGQIGVSGATLKYGGVAFGSFTGGVGTAPLVVTFNGNAKPANVQALLRRLVFSTKGDAPATLTRSIRLTLEDGDGGTTTTATRAIQVIAVNDPPVIGAFNGTVAYASGTTAKQIDPDATIQDVDSPNFAGGTLTVTLQGTSLGSDRLSILGQGTGTGKISLLGSAVQYEGFAIGGWTGGTGGTPLVITFNGNATTTAVQALLRRLAFDSTTAAGSVRTVQLLLTDGDGGDGGVVAKTISIV